VSAPGKRRTDVTRQAGTYGHVVDHFALGILTARAGVALFFCKQFEQQHEDRIKNLVLRFKNSNQNNRVLRGIAYNLNI
jgi:hypothetical protein